MAERTIRWGVLGPGGIAQRFAAALPHVPGARLQAVASRDSAKAAEFARKFGAETAYDSYEELVSDPAVDAVYIGTPHTLHCEQALLCIGHGKHALVEKPMSINAESERAMAQAAKSQGVFLMEAMWTRFQPANRHVAELLRSGRIGEPRLLTADFSFSFLSAPEHRLYNPALAGGALLDVGIYVMSCASMVFGPRPQSVSSFANIGPTGVDENTAILLQYPGGRIASLTCGVHAYGTGEAHIMGTEGRIALSPFWRAESVKVLDREGNVEETAFPFVCNGFEYEIAEAVECIRRGLTESPLMPLDESIAVMQAMDGMRKTWGLKYPAEEQA